MTLLATKLTLQHHQSSIQALTVKLCPYIHLFTCVERKGVGGICVLTQNIFVLFRLPRLPFLQSTYCMQIANALLISILTYSGDPNSGPSEFEYQATSTLHFTYYTTSGPRMASLYISVLFGLLKLGCLV